jgi:hypothetical protein
MAICSNFLFFKLKAGLLYLLSLIPELNTDRSGSGQAFQECKSKSAFAVFPDGFNKLQNW